VTRYDKRARNFLGAIYLAACVIWLNWWHALATSLFTILRSTLGQFCLWALFVTPSINIVNG
jgi:hypothetical protein